MQQLTTPAGRPVEPSDAERATWPDTTAQYVDYLEACEAHNTLLLARLERLVPQPSGPDHLNADDELHSAFWFGMWALAFLAAGGLAVFVFSL